MYSSFHRVVSVLLDFKDHIYEHDPDPAVNVKAANTLVMDSIGIMMAL